jgi:general stress protein 26
MAHHDRDDVEQRLWREIEKVRTGMLGLVGGPPRHMQPMTAFADNEDDKTKGGAIWFFCRKDNDMLREAGAGHAAMFTLLTKDDDFVACIGGSLREDHDRARIERFWNPVVGAWYPEGKDDPNLTLLRFDPKDAQVWISRGGAIRFGWEIAKANLTKTLPDVGESTHINL